MKARVIFIEADDVGPGEIGQVLAAAFNRMTQQSAAPTLPAEPPEESPAALPVPAPSAAAIAPVAERRRRRQAAGVSEEARARVDADIDRMLSEEESPGRVSPRASRGMYMCAGCGGDKPGGARGPRPRCPKCGGTTWEAKSNGVPR